MRVKRSSSRIRPSVAADGEGLVSRAGTALLSELADTLGLTEELAEAMASTRQRRSAHDPGEVLRDLAVVLADGGDCLAHLGALRDQPDLFGGVASGPTAWRVVASMDAGRLAAVELARARARARAWQLGAAPKGELVMDFDATLLTAHSEKERASGNYKHGFGFHPLLCYLDNTNEALAGILRPGNAAAHTPADHITVLDAALAQLPLPKLRGRRRILARADSAGATHDFINALRVDYARAREEMLARRRRAAGGRAAADAAMPTLTQVDELLRRENTTMAAVCGELGLRLRGQDLTRSRGLGLTEALDLFAKDVGALPANHGQLKRWSVRAGEALGGEVTPASVKAEVARRCLQQVAAGKEPLAVLARGTATAELGGGPRQQTRAPPRRTWDRDGIVAGLVVAIGSLPAGQSLRQRRLKEIAAAPEHRGTVPTASVVGRYLKRTPADTWQGLLAEAEQAAKKRA